jgi:hypothetical protein
VLCFRLRAEFLCNYEMHTVGSTEHREYWIPAQDVPKMNESIVGTIEVISKFRRE